MPAPLAPAIVAAIARAAVSNAAKKRLMQAAAKKVSEKDIKSLIRTEMKTGAPKLGRANRRPDVANPPKRVVSREGQTGSVRPPKADPAKELYNLYKKKPDTKTVTKSMQKERVTPADVRALRAKERGERVSEALKPLLPRGTAAKGTSVAGPKRGPSVQVAKPSPATERAKVAIPKDTKIDASRKAAMKAAEQARSRKTPAEREKEFNLPKTDAPLKNELSNIKKIIGEMSKPQRDAFQQNDDIANAFFRKYGVGVTDISKKEAANIAKKASAYLAKKGIK
jgi:hypothetical protein